MPGICGITGVGGPEAAECVEQMLGALRQFDWHRSERDAGDEHAFGRVAVEGTPAADAPAFARAGDLVVAFDGELYDGPGLASTVSAVQYLAAGLSTAGASFLRAVHGCFVLAAWNTAARQLTLATDRFGMRPCYWAQTPGSVRFAAGIEALLADGEVPRRLSERGVSEFFAFGQFLGDSTLYESVRALPPAAWLTWDAASDRVRVDQYAQLEAEAGSHTDAAWIDTIEARMVHAVEQACRGSGGLGLSLSGGLDARTILGLAPPDTRITCVSLGMPGSIDGRSAAALARLAGQPHRSQLLDGDFLGRFEELLLAVVRLTDGHYLDQGIVLSTMGTYRDLGIGTLLRGHAGELMHMSKAYAFSMDAEGQRLSSGAALDDWLWRHLSGYMLGEADEAMFAGGLAARMRDAARASLAARAARHAGVEPVPQRIWRLFVAERLHRETAASLQMFRAFTEVRVPLLEPALVAALLGAPVHLKIGDTIQEQVLRRRRPEFLRVTNANTGAPMGAGPARIGASHFAMRVFAKLGVPGYQPYERLGLWLARDLQPLLRRVLLGDEFLAREVFSREAVERLIEQHARRARNHTFLLQAMLVFELGQRQSDARTAAVRHAR